MDGRTARTSGPRDGAEAEELEQVVRRVARARVRDPHLVDDVVQETLERVFSRGDDLEPAARQPYAIVVATNLIATKLRTEGRRSRHLHRLGDPTSPELPEETFLRRDEHRSMQDALGRLSPRDREVLLAHEVLDITTKELAEGARTSSGAIAVRLAAARAKLRVEYVLSHRREPPSPTALPLRPAGALLARRSAAHRPLGGPAPGVVRAVRLPERARLHPQPCVGCARARAGGSLGGRARLVGSARQPGTGRGRHGRGRRRCTHRAVGVVGPHHRGTRSRSAGHRIVDRCASLPQAPSDAGPVRVGAVDLRSIPQEQLGGERVTVRSAPVGEVPADEGFWMGDGAGGRIWVQLVGGGESAVAVEPGATVTFDGSLLEASEGFAEGVGVTEAEGAAELAPGAIDIEVDATEVALR